MKHVNEGRSEGMLQLSLDELGPYIHLFYQMGMIELGGLTMGCARLLDQQIEQHEVEHGEVESLEQKLMMCFYNTAKLVNQLMILPFVDTVGFGASVTMTYFSAYLEDEEREAMEAQFDALMDNHLTAMFEEKVNQGEIKSAHHPKMAMMYAKYYLAELEIEKKNLKSVAFTSQEELSPKQVKRVVKSHFKGQEAQKQCERLMREKL